METPTTRDSAVREALRGLIDYAGLFPPANLELREATDEYRRALAGRFAWMLRGFIVPSSLLATSARALGETPLCVILDGGREPAAWRERIAAAVAQVAQLGANGARIQVLEVALAPGFSGAAAIAALRGFREALEAAHLGGVQTYVELPRGEWNALLDDVLAESARLGLRAKLRCGGVDAAAFPSVDEVAAFLAATCAAQVPFKATAGLHHPIRHRDGSTGSYMHGFLNLLIAAALCGRVDRATLREAIAEEDALAFSLDAAHLHWRSHSLNVETLARTRRDRFVSYGSCSFAEPVDDLIALEMLAP